MSQPCAPRSQRAEVELCNEQRQAGHAASVQRRECARRDRGGIVSGADGRPAILLAQASTIRVVVGSRVHVVSEHIASCGRITRRPVPLWRSRFEGSQRRPAAEEASWIYVQRTRGPEESGQEMQRVMRRMQLPLRRETCTVHRQCAPRRGKIPQGTLPGSPQRPDRPTRSDGRIEPGCYGVQFADEVSALTKSARQDLAPDIRARFKDDLTGQTLRDDLVKAARVKELEFFNSKQKPVWLQANDRGHLRRRTARRLARAGWMSITVTRTPRTTAPGMWLDSSRPQTRRARRTSHRPPHLKPCERSWV